MRVCPSCGLLAKDQRSLCVQCGTLLPEAVSEEFVVDGRYQVESQLGEGSMGVVYLCRDLGLERQVAVKILPPDFGGKPEILARFRREASLLAMMRNPHVVQIYTFGPYGQTYFFAMEFVRGTTLEDTLLALRREKRLFPPSEVLGLLGKLAGALDDVHEHQLIHRDLKPANILLEEGTRRPVIIDFGLARGLRSGSRRHSIRGGTPTYAAPEQILGGEVDAASDQYSLACIAFELLTGREAFTHEDTVALLRSHLRDTPPRAGDLVPEAARFDAVLGRALDKKPTHRFESCAAFVNALEKASKLPAPASSRPAEPTGSHVTAAGPRGPRVFVVDYDEGFVKTAGRAAKVALFGQRVGFVACNTAADALDHAAKAGPDLLLVTQYPTGPDSTALLRMLGAGTPECTFDVLMVGERWGAAERARFEALGVREFLPQPVSFSDLAERIQKIAVRRGWVGPKDPARDTGEE